MSTGTGYQFSCANGDDELRRGCKLYPPTFSLNQATAKRFPSIVITYNRMVCRLHYKRKRSDWDRINGVYDLIHIKLKNEVHRYYVSRLEKLGKFQLLSTTSVL